MSRLAESLAAGRFVVTAEMPTIDGGGRDEVRLQLEPMRAYLDAANATDNTAAHAHASPLAVAIALREEGVEPIMQLVCRDRNRLALEADIVGASMHGIENVCCLTGDDVTAGDEPEARRVFDLDAPTLIATAQGIAEGRYLSGRSGRSGAAALHRLRREPGRAAVRVPRRPGAQEGGRRAPGSSSSRSRFEPERLETFMAEAVRTGLAERVAILPSITILRSAAALRFIDAHVPGISVPAAVIERVEAAPDQLEACLDLAYEQAAPCHGAARASRGLHFISFRKDAGIAKTCRRLGIPTYAERVEHGYRSPVAV